LGGLQDLQHEGPQAGAGSRLLEQALFLKNLAVAVFNATNNKLIN
jgi:hypothetical protein